MRFFCCTLALLVMLPASVAAEFEAEPRLIGWLGEKRQRPSILRRAANETVLLNSGYVMPRVGFGTAGLGDRTQLATLSALRCGYRLVDSAQAREWYREDMVGAAVAESKVPREKLFLVSKIHPRHLGFDATTAQLAVSLRELRTHFLDLLLLHYPECWGDLCNGQRPEGTWQDSWRALEAMQRAGTVRSIGVSNFDVRQLESLLAFSTIKPAVVQASSEPLNQNRALRKLCSDAGVAFTAYSSLGTQYGRATSPVLNAAPVLAAAAMHNVSPAQVVLRWALDGGQAVVPRSASEAHQRQNLDLDFFLTVEERAAIDALDGTKPTDRR